MRFQTYKIPVIVLLRDTPKEAVCQVFEKVKTGGVSLTVFELVTATFAADDFQLRRDWEQRVERIAEKRPVLQDLDGTDFLTAVTLCSTYRRSIKSGGAVGCKPVALRNDAFETFIRDRAIKLLDLIERATGKQVTGRDSDETVSAFGAALVAPSAAAGAAVA